MADVTVAGVTVTVSGGDLGPGASWEKDNHINDSDAYNASNAWASSQSNDSVPDVAGDAYIGIDLGAGATAVLDSILYTSSGAAGNSIEGTDVLSFQYSDDGAAWTEHEKMSPTSLARSPGGESQVFASSTPAKRFFRVLALANPPGIPGSVWGVAEIEYHGTLGSGGGGGGGGLGGGIGRRQRRRR